MSDDIAQYDKRTIERKIKHGDVDEDDYQEYLDNLEDVSDNAEEIEAEFEVGVLEEDEDDLEEEEADDEDASDEEAEEEEEED